MESIYNIYNELSNEYGIFFPYLFILLFLLFLSKVRLNGHIFQKSSDSFIPKWILEGLQANKKNAIVNFLIGCVMTTMAYYTNFLSLYYFSWFAFGISFAFLSFEVFHYFFPTSEIIPTRRARGKLGKDDIAVYGLIAFFLFVEYYQQRWPTFLEDQVLGRLRVLFDISGKAFYNSMAILVILKLARHRINVISVILLLSLSLLSSYIFLNTIFAKGGYDNEGYAFSFILAFATTIFILDDVKTGKANEN